MKSILKSKQNGFAIIEALIAFLLLGIGVAALLYLQGNLMGGSSLSKARAEAMELAKDRTELLRNYIHKDQFISALNTAQDNVDVTGENAIYAVTYELENAVIDSSNPPKPEEAQLLTVTVSWTGSDEESENVQLETQLYFTDPVILSALGSDDSGEGGGIFPLVSPWIAGVEKRHHSTYLDGYDNDRSGKEEHRVMEIDGDTIRFSPISVEINTYTNSGTGRSNVEVVVGGDVKLTSFGGIVHQFKGDVIIDPGAGSSMITLKKSIGLDLFASPTSYCLFSICEDPLFVDEVCKKSNGAEYVSYICYVPGDCTYGDVDGDDKTGCPNPFLPPIGMDDLNGGWYGSIGNFNVNLPGDKVCTAETAGKMRTPSRNYDTHRFGDPNDTEIITGNEGINTPYSNQTFLIVNKNHDCSVKIGDYSFDNNYLVNDHIERKLVGQKFDEDNGWEKNVVLPENLCVEVDASDDHDPSCPNPNPSTP